jgi:hypothetical protein
VNIILQPNAIEQLVVEVVKSSEELVVEKLQVLEGVVRKWEEELKQVATL